MNAVILDRFEASVASGLESIRARIRAAGGDPEHVVVVAMTKGFGPEAAVAAVHHGLCDLGENQASDLVEKATLLHDFPIRWHFLGALQTNKFNRLSPHVSLWQTLDSIDHARALAARVPGADVLVQVQLVESPNRAGALDSVTGVHRDY